MLASSFSIYGSGYIYKCPRCGAERTGERRTADLEAGRFEVLCARCGSEATILPITEDATPQPLAQADPGRGPVDPPVSSGRGADACGIVAAGVDESGLGYVLEDETVQGLPPQGWAARAVALYRRLQADALVAEVNQGGEMVAAVVRLVDAAVPVTTVVATRGKYARAEPVSALHAQNRVRHVGAFPELEDEMCDFGPGGLSTRRSPDRLDALVWALTHLMLTGAEPRVRVL